MGTEARASIQINNPEYISLMETYSPPYSLSSQKSILDRRSSILEKIKILGKARILGLSASSGLLFMGTFMGNSTLLEMGGVTLFTSFIVSYIHDNVRSDFRLVEKLRLERGLEFDSE